MRKIFLSIILLAPITALAQNSNVDDVLDYVFGMLDVATDILVSLAMAWFFWALIKFIWISSEGKEDLAKHKEMLIWSSIALFMMFGIWSIVGYVQTSTGVDLSQSDIYLTPVLPKEY